MDQALVRRYNYDEFVPEKFEPWLNFQASPAIGEKAPDFPLWRMDQSQTSLMEVVQSHRFTVIEFGSFT